MKIKGGFCGIPWGFFVGMVLASLLIFVLMCFLNISLI